MNAATDIYMKVTFSENLAHTTNDSPNGRPAMGYQIGTTAGSFDIVANTVTLATGDCRPDATPPADVYQCLYTTGSTDSGKFELLIDRRVEDEAGNTLGTVYRHAAGIQIDTTAPTYSSASVTGATLTVTFSENLDTDSTAKAANSAWDVQVTPSGGSADARSVSSYSVTGKTAVLTLASAVVGTDTVTVAYNQPSGTDPKLADLAGNPVADISAQSVTVGTSGPSVIQASSGYFENAALTTPRTGAVKAGAENLRQGHLRQERLPRHQLPGGGAPGDQFQDWHGDRAAVPRRGGTARRSQAATAARTRRRRRTCTSACTRR